MKKPILFLAVFTLLFSVLSISETSHEYIDSANNAERYLSSQKAPTAPSGLTAARISSSQILLTWTDNSSNEQGFKIERRVGTDPFVQVGNSAANFAVQSPWTGTLSYLDRGLDKNTTYEYRICAYDTTGDSAYTAPASAKTYNWGDFYYYDDILDSNLRYVPATDDFVPGIPRTGFTQGSPSTEDCRNADETEFTHILSRSLAVVPTEVTRQMWADLRTAQPSLPADPTNTSLSPTVNHPVQNVTWFETILFANLLSLEQGFERVYYKDQDFQTVVDSTNYSSGTIYMHPNADGYRLPTEGEWEHFTRAGTATPFWIDEPNYDSTTCNSSNPADLTYLVTAAAYRANTGREASEAAQYAANPWGLYDVHGNVWEHCWDLYGTYPTGTVKDYTGDPSGTTRVIRGGSWIGFPKDIRSAIRSSQNPASRNTRVGFRLVRPVFHDHVYEYDTFTGNMIFVPKTGEAGYFQGSDPDDYCFKGRETPRFIHRLSRNIIVMETEVSHKMWQKLRLATQYSSENLRLPADPSNPPEEENHSSCPDYSPVNSISFRQAVLYANLLSFEVGNGIIPCYYADPECTTTPIDASNYLSAPIYFNWDADGYRLPTEGEWEYFARAGTTGPFSIEEAEYTNYPCSYAYPVPGDYPALDTVATFRSNSAPDSGGDYFDDAKTTPVGYRDPNPWNLYDIHGNVWERCWDAFNHSAEHDYPDAENYGTDPEIIGVYTDGTNDYAIVEDWTTPEGYAHRVIRGGGLWSRAEHLRCAVRFSYRGFTAFGFRLVRTIDISKISRKTK